MVTTKFHESNEPWKIVSSSSSTCLFLIFFFFFSFRYFYKFCIFHLRIPSYFTFFFLPIFGSLKEFKFLNFFLNDEIDSIFFLPFSFCSISFKVSYFLYPLHSCISTPLIIISLLLLLPFEFSLFIHLSCSPSVRIPLCPDIISRGSCRNISRHQYSPPPFPLEWNSLPLFFFLLLSFFPFFFPFFPFFRNRPRIINGRTILFASPFFQ